jgi:hypothetical protein
MKIVKHNYIFNIWNTGFVATFTMLCGSMRPGFASGQHVGFVVDKAALGHVFSEYFGFLCQSFHRFLHHHNHPGLVQ